MDLTFLGAAGEVTGSCYLINAMRSRFLVDCGMFQGDREAQAKNLHALEFDAGTIDFVLLTHAHIDHCGLLPRLVARGFRGPIYTTPATADLLEVMLMDSAHVQAKDAERAARHRNHRADHAPEESEETVLYTVQEAMATLRHLRPVAYGVDFSPAKDVRVRFRDAGHILGAAWIELWLATAGGGERKIVFSGDIGERGRPIMRDPERPDRADVLLIESTYGDREHRSMEETYREFAQVLEDTLVNRRGNVIVPAFAVGRIQEVLYVLCRLAREGRVRGPRGGMQVFVDSPMGARATELTLKHHRILDADTLDVLQAIADRGGARHRPGQPSIHFTETPEESMAINRIDSGAVIIAASGMCDAGRIRHHLRQRLNRQENTIVFTGFQAHGTLGRRLVDGARTVRLFGEEIDVRARVVTIGGLSAHAGQSGLLHWMEGVAPPPGRVYVVHGEANSAGALRERVAAKPGWQETSVAVRFSTVTL